MSKKSLHAAIDLGAENVKVVLVEGRRPVAAAKAKRRDYNDVEIFSDTEGILRATEEALVKAERKVGGQATSTVIGFSHPQIRGASRSARLTRRSPKTPISTSEMGRLVGKVQENTRHAAEEMIRAETGNPDTKVAMMNSLVSNITVDGVEVENPVGLRGEKLSFSVYTLFAPALYLALVQRLATEMALELTSVVGASFALQLLAESQDIKDGIVIDIGERTTDILTLENGAPINSLTVSLGGAMITKAIKDEFEVGTASAEKLKTYMADTRLPDGPREHLAETVAQATDKYLAILKITLGDLPKTIRSSPNIYLAGGGAELTTLQEQMALSPWWRGYFINRPTVHLLDEHPAFALALALAKVELPKSKGILNRLLKR